MTATSAGSSSCLPAKGLGISLAALQRHDPYINNIVDLASQVALYTYNNRTNEWEKTEVEGSLFIYTRLASPRHGFTIMNRLNMENLTEPITKDLDFQLQHPFLLYRNARLVIHGIWFYDKEDCQRIAQRMKILTQQEQALAQSQGGGGSEAKTVDIIQMLTKARTEYDKSTSEPKEIGGSSVLSGNPNLIKPIPVKPNAQDSEVAEPKSLSLATLFGSQHQHHHSSKTDPVSPLAAPAEGPSTGKVTRPPVARTLTYEDAVKPSRDAPSREGSAAVAGCTDRGLVAVVRGQTVGGDGKNIAAGLAPSPTAAQQQQNQPQHCPAIQKLMQGQRGVVGVLQTVSESPENRLCDNGVPLELHHHHHMLHHHHHQQQHLHHHHHHHQEPQLDPDPIKRLFQTPPLPPSSTSDPSPVQLKPSLSSQPSVVDSKPRSHLQLQQNQQPTFNLHKPQPETQHSSQSASNTHGTGLLPSQVTNHQVLQTSQGQFPQMPGVVSPGELLLKLQLVQQEQSLASHDPRRLCHGLAPRFLGPAQSQGAGSDANLTPATAGQKVISPQQIPAAVAPNQLLSPSVFTQAKTGGRLTAVSKESRPATSTSSRPPLQEEIRVLSRSQLQSTLLNLIQTDGSFLDTIYEAYVSRFAHNSSSKY